MTSRDFEDDFFLGRDHAALEKYTSRAETHIFELHSDKSQIRVLALDHPMKVRGSMTITTTLVSDHGTTASVSFQGTEGMIKDRVPPMTGPHTEIVRNMKELEYIMEQTKHILRIL